MPCGGRCRRRRHARFSPTRPASATRPWWGSVFRPTSRPTGWTGGPGAGHCPGMRDSDFEACRLTVRLGAIAENYRFFQRLAGPAAVAGMVKADAYGLGADRVAPALAGAGCDP